MIETMKGKKFYTDYEKGYQQGRADTIDEVKRYTDRNFHFLNAKEQIEFVKFLNQLKEQK